VTRGVAQDSQKRAVSPGRSYPLGANWTGDGVNFSVFAKSSTGAQLLLFDDADAPTPSRVIDFDPQLNRTYHYWHVFVPGLAPGQVYGYRIGGPADPSNGLRFDRDKLLLDPYGKAVAFPASRSREAARLPGDNAATALRSVVVDPAAYDWEGDAPLGRPFTETIIYEMHVGGFTRNPNSGVAPSRRGTYAGLIDKIPYLADLGVTAVELLPVFAFDPLDAPPGLGNYWGYQPLSFFAPHPAYSAKTDPLAVLDEFRDMVKALHRAGIEVILDVVYNHTTEGSENGPTICFRGFANPNYYMLADDKARYDDFTGCGNTFNANEPIVRRLILDSLRYWVSEMHVDGFRFDLASILSRDETGRPLASPPILWDIETDPVLANVKLIAEAWDAAGLYQVGSFVGDSWKEWNGRFRDDLRGFLKGDGGLARAVAYRITGSPDIFAHEGREPEQSVNFVTCHDGFTLNDLVSYNDKHNERNGEDNRDGANDNRSWNCGSEGPTTDGEIERLRTRQIKNFIALTLLSIGTPMLLAGDEVRRSQNGNNNAYCQDNELSWFDWSLVDKHGDILRFVKMMIALRRGRDLRVEHLDLTLEELLRYQQVAWHGVRLNEPDWRYESHSLAATISLIGYPATLHLMFNAYWEPLDFAVPPPDAASEAWRVCIDTAADAPHDICAVTEAPIVNDDTYRVEPRSVVMLLSRSATG
jgi:glycogen operon protein